MRVDTVQRYKEFFKKVFIELCPSCNGVMTIVEIEKEEFERGYRYAKFCDECGLRKLISYNELFETSKEFGLESLVKAI